MSSNTITETRQYLTFRLGEELYALDIANVREVLDYTSITRVPRMPESMLGVINLRGSVVPVIDMRLKFGIAPTEKTVNTCIVIVEVTMDDESIIIGALVDSVQEVFDLEPSQVEPPPRLGKKLNTDFIKGMGKREDEFVIILEINRVFSVDEVAGVADALEDEAGAEIRE